MTGGDLAVKPERNIILGRCNCTAVYGSNQQGSSGGGPFNVFPRRVAEQNNDTKRLKLVLFDAQRTSLEHAQLCPIFARAKSELE